MSTHGLYIIEDSDAPKGSPNYTTLVMLHGFGWHSGVFSRMVPLCQRYNTRVILVNRRGYLGTKPFTDDENTKLQSAAGETEPAVALAKLSDIMKDLAHEVCNLLIDLVRQDFIPPARPKANEGGFVLAGWSMATTWMMALLANAAYFPVEDVDLSRYVRRIVFYDPSYQNIGFPAPDPPADIWNPIHEAAELTPQQFADLFAHWASGYFEHGDTLDTLERRTPLPTPPPSVMSMTDEERANGMPTMHDRILHEAMGRLGFYDHLRRAALYFAPLPGSRVDDDGCALVDGLGGRSDNRDRRPAGWANVEVRYVWCDRSPWEITWGMWRMREELDARNKARKPMRDVGILRLEGANHFAHRDCPERPMEAFLGECKDKLEYV